MSVLAIQEGATDVIVNTVWVNKSDGTYATAVDFNSAGISVNYVRRGFDDAAITLADGTDPDVADDAHSDGQFIHVYNGICRLDLPDAVCASGMAAGQKWVTITGESDDYEMLPLTIQLTEGVPGAAPPTAGAIADQVHEEALADHSGVSGSLAERVTRIPNVAAAADGGLPTVDANNAVKVQSGSGANQVDLSSGKVLLQSTQTGVTIPTVTTLTGHTAQTGDAFARLGAPAGASVSADVAALLTALQAVDVVVKKNTARSNNMIYMETTDGDPATGATVTIEISKDGGAFTGIGGAVSEVSDGWYKFDLAQAELNADTVALKGTATGCKQRNMLILTQS